MPHVPGHVLVGFRADVGRTAITNVTRRTSLRVLERFDGLGIGLLKVPQGLNVETALRRLERDPAVGWAEPDYLRYAQANPPTDALFADQWDLNNIGQLHAVAETSLDGPASDHAGSNDADIDAPEAWATTEGTNTTVIAVIDSGVDFTHFDLNTQAWVNGGETPGNHVDDDSNGFTDDVNGWDFGNGDDTLVSPVHWEGFDHGTHVAGTIAAAHDDATGTVGVCPGCRIMALKFAKDADGAMSVSNEVKALAYAKANGAQIANMSLGGPQWSNAEREAIRKFGRLTVVAAGNDSLDNDMLLDVDTNHDGTADTFSPQYPAAYSLSNVLTVAASNDQDRYAYSTECFAILGSRTRCAFTNWGHDSVDVAAPGADITSTVPGGSWETWDGTSMAAPHVAGVAGLVLSAHAGYSAAQLKNALMHGVDQRATLKTMYLAPPIGKQKSGNFTRTSGRVNAEKALTASTLNATPISDGNIDHARSWSTAKKSGSVAWQADINDVYKRGLSHGHTYRFALTVPRGEDYDLVVWKPGTKEIWQLDASKKLQKASAHGNGVDEEVTFKAGQTGTYYVQVTAWLFKAGKYTLTFKKVS